MADVRARPADPHEAALHRAFSGTGREKGGLSVGVRVVRQLAALAVDGAAPNRQARRGGRKRRAAVPGVAGRALLRGDGHRSMAQGARGPPAVRGIRTRGGPAMTPIPAPSAPVFELSIVVPVYNGARTLPELVAALS